MEKIIILFYLEVSKKCKHCNRYTLKKGVCSNSKCKEYRKVQYEVEE